MAKRPVRSNTLGPFSKGLNTFSDPSAVPEDGLAELLNMELDLDGSLVSRPPFHDVNVPLTVPLGGTMNILGIYYTPAGGEFLIASDGVSSTYRFSGGAWQLITNTISATAMHQFDDKAWLLAGVGSVAPGGYWTPSAGFVAEPNMPRGTVIVSFKYRLWVAQGEQATANGSRLYFSKILGVTPFWPAAPEFIDVARGDGQNIVNILTYYDSLLIFRTASIYRYQYGSDPANGTIDVSVPNVGLDSRWALAAHETFFYFMYEGRAYEFMNGRVQDISQAIVLEAASRQTPRQQALAVSVFNGRALFSFYGTLYVFSLKTRTWSRWLSPSRGGIARVVERRTVTSEAPQAYVSSSTPPAVSGAGARLMTITDDITSDSEDFVCLVRTRVYSFNTPSTYKRMFWWGLDGIFRMDVTARAVPIAYGGQVTWGELLSRGATWGSLLLGSWGRPADPTLVVETVRNERGSAAQRKFSKFRKGLRFRQIQFEVEFQTRGNLDTAPARLFSLHVEMRDAQGASKEIS